MYGLSLACVSVHQMMTVINGGLERTFDPLKLELETFVSCHVVAEN